MEPVRIFGHIPFVKVVAHSLQVLHAFRGLGVAATQPECSEYSMRGLCRESPSINAMPLTNLQKKTPKPKY